MELLDPDLFLPIIGAIVASAIIGAEREYRASPAGLRTHILVGLSCCVLMLAAVHQMEWLNDAPVEVVRIDPVRMAHGILTGIGFLCGGVIFREGFNVRGLTTAASLWMTATLGVLFGIGFNALAVFAATATVIVLAAVTITDRLAPQQRIVHLKVRYRRSKPIVLADFGALLADHKLKSITIDQSMNDDVVEYGAIAHGYSENRAEQLAASLLGDPSVTGFEVCPQQA